MGTQSGTSYGRHHGHRPGAHGPMGLWGVYEVQEGQDERQVGKHPHPRGRCVQRVKTPQGARELSRSLTRAAAAEGRSAHYLARRLGGGKCLGVFVEEED